MTTEITSTSTLTDIWDILAADGITHMASFYFGIGEHHHATAKYLLSNWDNDKGYIFSTQADMDEWEDTRYLTIHYGAAEGVDLYDIETPLLIAIGRANFAHVAGTKTRNSITLHVPKSRF